MDSENDESLDMDHLALWIFVFSALCFFIIGVIATVGSILTTIALATSSTKKSATTLLVINLTASILPICLCTMPFLTVLCLEKVFSSSGFISPKSMKAVYVITSICNQVELHTIAALAFNRACAVSSPPFYKRYLNRPQIIRNSLTSIWIYSIILWIPVSFGVWGEIEVHKDKYFVEIKDDTPTRPLILIFFCFVLPFLVAVGCHFIMFFKFRKSRFLKAENMVRPWKNHVTKAMTIIFLIQCTFSIPHFIVHILKRKGSWPRLWLFIHIFYFSRFCLNPFVYIYSSHHYKKDFVRILKRAYCFGWKKSVSPNNEEPNLDTIERLTGQPSSKEVEDAL